LLPTGGLTRRATFDAARHRDLHKSLYGGRTHAANRRRGNGEQKKTKYFMAFLDFFPF